MADDKFKLPTSSYEELTKIIRAYGRFNEPKELVDVSKLVAISTTTISGNAGFLTAVGILQPGAKKQATPAGKDLAQALEHGLAEEVTRSWRRIVDDSDFLSKIVTAVRIRNGMDQQTLEAHVAYSAGQPKKPVFMTGARTVIDILRIAELLREADGKYVAAAATVAVEPLMQATHGGSIGTAVPPQSGLASFTVTGIREGQPRIVPTGVQTIQEPQRVNINVNITCTPADLDGLGEKLRQLLEHLYRQTDGPGGEAE